jgi:hypothetical protein
MAIWRSAAAAAATGENNESGGVSERKAERKLESLASNKGFHNVGGGESQWHLMLASYENKRAGGQLALSQWLGWLNGGGGEYR